MVFANDLTKHQASNARTINAAEPLSSNVPHFQYNSLSQQKAVKKHSSPHRKSIAVPLCKDGQSHFGSIKPLKIESGEVPPGLAKPRKLVE